MIEAFQSLVRPLVTILIALAVIVGFLWFHLISADQFMPIVTLVIGFYFVVRSADKTTDKVLDAVKSMNSNPPPNPPNPPTGG